MTERCTNTVAINFPCQYDDGHMGVCQPDTERQLRIYGVQLEDIRRIGKDLADARRLGVADGAGKRTQFGRYIVLKAALQRMLERCHRNDVYVSDIEDAMKQADSDSERWESGEERLARFSAD